MNYVTQNVAEARMAGANAVQRFVVMEEAVCCLCNKPVWGTDATLAVRMLSDGGTRFGFGMGTMCTTCVPLHDRVIEPKAPFFTILMARLDRALEATPKKDAEPGAVMERVLKHMNATIKDVLRETGALQKTCAMCPKTKHKACAGCLIIRYCGAECQAADWARHKSECKALKSCVLFPNTTPREI